ncbi:ABC transporter permease [uncultured Roseivirga sp.]|uniref:ABC transporter permease n=2 Tax=Roseivirga TaxID=290180 RepID=UPI0025831332|nr:ABC transporter permease [uncultured Roseivirga sp.]
MLRNMFMLAWRNAIRHKQFAILNILGLTIGITATVIIALYVMNQYSYDNFHSKGERIYRVNQPMIWGDWNEPFASTGPNLAIALRADVPEFKEVTRVHTPGEMAVSYLPEGGNPISFTESRAFVAEQNFFEIFDFKAKTGSLETALEVPGNVVITQETATKYFGTEEAIGKTLLVNQGTDSFAFRVAAVLEDIPTNSHIQFNMLLSMASFDDIEQRQHQWIWTTFVTYGLVAEGVDIDKLEAKIQSIPPKWAEQEIQNIFGQSYVEYIKDRTWTLELQPLSEVYLYSPPSGNRIGPSGNILYIQIFSAVGGLILLLCSINFMNLSTAKSANRAKEVGIRKVLGSEKRALVQQFIFESILYVTVSTVIALVVTEISLDAFNLIANTELSLYRYATNPAAIGLIAAFVVLLGIAAGSYPAFYLSSFSPIKVLKGKLSSGFKGSVLRNTLVVVQFTISVALIIATFFVQKQLNFVLNMNLGFNTENILQVHNMEMLTNEQQQTLQAMLATNPAFEQVGISDLIPPNVWNEDKYKAYGPDTESVTLNRIRCNEEYIDLLGLNFLEGRNFDKTRGTDQYKVILNEEAVKVLGWEYPVNPENSPVGQYITFPNSNEALFEVIGIVENFNHNSVRYEIGPLLLIHQENDIMWKHSNNYLSIRLNGGAIASKASLESSLKNIEASVKEVDAAIPFEYSFMDQMFEANFRTEQRMGQVLNIFTAMALTIACLGLFGLSAFAAEQRKKELGIRKVLGATARQIIASFTKEFSILIVLSIVIASPLAYFFTKNWLSNFAYQTSIEVWVFVLVGGVSIVIAWLTIGVHSLNAARQNPSEVLRDE